MKNYFFIINQNFALVLQSLTHFESSFYFESLVTDYEPFFISKLF